MHLRQVTSAVQNVWGRFQVGQYSQYLYEPLLESENPPYPRAEHGVSLRTLESGESSSPPPPGVEAEAEPKTLDNDGDDDDDLSMPVPAARGRSRLWSLVPFFVTSPLGKTSRTLPAVNSTSYLNGLRGVACVVVFNQHLGMPFAGWLQHPWGEGDDATHNRHLAQLPFVRLVHCGLFMVCVFFVLSGFVLAYSPLRKINSAAYAIRSDLRADATAAAVLTGLSSSLFRRPLRLFVPMFGAVLVTAVATFWFPHFDRGGWDAGHPSFLAHAWTVLGLAAPLLNPFGWGYYWPRGFTHGWTLQLEYRGSIVVFLLVLLTCRMSPRARKLAMCAAFAFAMYHQRWEVGCFVAGVLLAELRHAPLSHDFPRTSAFLAARAKAALLRASSPSRPSSPASDSGRDPLPLHHNDRPLARWLSVSAWTTVLLMALLFGGWPTHGAASVLPYRALYAVTPAQWATHGSYEPDPAQMYWCTVGAALLVLSMDHLPAAQWLFTRRVMVYLGEVSYAFYLLHQAVLFSIGGSLNAYLVERHGWSENYAFWVFYAVTLAVLLCIADLFWRLVDEPVVKASRKVAEWFGIR